MVGTTSGLLVLQVLIVVLTIYSLRSSTGGLDTATAVTPMIDLSAALSDAELTFWMHAYGVAIGTLDVGVSTSATGPFTSLILITGAVQTLNDPWAQIGINLASYVGQQVYVRFTYIENYWCYFLSR